MVGVPTTRCPLLGERGQPTGVWARGSSGCRVGWCHTLGDIIVAMSTPTVELRPELVDWPYTRPVTAALVGVVNTLRERDQALVTLGDLAELLPGRAPQSTARALRQAGWLFPMRTRGVWGVSAVLWGAHHVPEFTELHARMLVRPDTPACISGKSVAMLHGWLWRPVGPSIGMPPKVKVPQCLNEFHIDRWAPQIDLDTIHGLGMWKPETLIAYMAARPSRISWEDIKQWLWALCEHLDLDLLLAELEGRPRAVWMKTGYLADVGERPELGESLVAAAPTNAHGPYLLGWRERRWPYPIWKPQWVPKYEVMDYLLPMRWSPKVGFEPFEPPKTWGSGAAASVAAAGSSSDGAVGRSTAK